MTDEVETRWLTPDDARLMQVSYAQNFEDVRLNRALRNTTGFYIDVGANHPVFHSVTKAFYDRGWRGINLEPSPKLYRALCAARPRDTSLNVGVSDAEGSLTFYEAPGFLHGWSTFDPRAVESYRRQGVEVQPRSVPVTTLAAICAEHAPPVIDFLKIDAECYELQVLRGADWERWRPRIVLIEAGLPELVAQWEPLMDAAGYQVAAFDGINRYYTPREDNSLLDLLAPPFSALDHAISYDHVRFLDALERTSAERDRASAERDQVSAERDRLSAERDQVSRQLEGLLSLGPVALGIAHRLHALAVRHPRLAASVGRLLRRVG